MITEAQLEGARDPRTTDEILFGVVQVEPSDRSSDWWRSPRYYQFYSGVAALRRPREVLEVGVRLGYSLVAMLRGADGVRSAVGIDNECYVRGSQGRAAENVRASGYGGALELIRTGSAEAMAALRPESFDLVHLDGAHDAEGVRRDVLEGWRLLRKGGLMMVDDTSHLPGVSPGVRAALPDLEGVATNFFFPTFRGWWVAEKGVD